MPRTIGKWEIEMSYNQRKDMKKSRDIRPMSYITASYVGTPFYEGWKFYKKAQNEKYVEEKIKVFTSMDKEKILAWARTHKRNRFVEDQDDEIMFWAHVHTLRTLFAKMPPEARLESAMWLNRYGFDHCASDLISEGSGKH